jgi:hypothetical protein
MARRSDALVPALIGLTGVLIGALVTAGITYLGDRAHRIADKRTAKRLISNEVRLDTQRLIVVSALGRLPGAQPRTVQWESQAPTLARYVSSRDWSQVSAFYDDLLNLEHSLLRRPCVSVGTWRLAVGNDRREERQRRVHGAGTSTHSRHFESSRCLSLPRTCCRAIVRVGKSLSHPAAIDRGVSGRVARRGVAPPSSGSDQAERSASW